MSCKRCNGPTIPALHEDMLEGAEKREHRRVPAVLCQHCGHVEAAPGAGVQLTEQGSKRLLTEQR